MLLPAEYLCGPFNNINLSINLYGDVLCRDVLYVRRIETLECCKSCVHVMPESSIPHKVLCNSVVDIQYYVDIV
jgi:hypothetical protein